MSAYKHEYEARGIPQQGLAHMERARTPKRRTLLHSFSELATTLKHFNYL